MKWASSKGISCCPSPSWCCRLRKTPDAAVRKDFVHVEKNELDAAGAVLATQECRRHIRILRASLRRPRRRGSDLAPVTPAFLSLLPGVGLERREGALKKGIVHDVAFPVFTLHDPVAAPYVAKSEIGGDGLFFRALRCID